ncbi:ATP-binding cassette sub-family C member 4-like isoform X1 [Neodiprion fabricii]|uniref:ATP-binding cassette sub-family C member 4-like isoform X1 n=1 Tax=Neodiprion fabricii TaxID=2872261 RepID=UPI001ED946B9|nr:ATP-binding cassette sub-family C member 4-like isoform X1 [Neodiprion fabricii]
MNSEVKHSQKNPEEKSNFLSLLVFGWMAPIFWKGAKRDLQITDLQYDPLRTDQSEYLGDLLEREWSKELLESEVELTRKENGEKKAKKRASLTRAIIRAFWFPYMLQGLLLLVQSTALHVSQPMLQEWIIGYFNHGEKNLVTQTEVLVYAGCLVIVTLLVVFITHHTTLRTQQIGMRVRVACCSILYRKILRIDQASFNNTASGRVANLISNDVARFDMVPVFLHHIWIMPIQVMLIGYVMWRSVGVASLVGIGTMMLQTIPIQGYLSHLSAKLRSKIAVKTDERVHLTSELILGIQVVKMYSWEKPFESIMSKVRGLEVKLIGYTSYLRGFYLSVMAFSERVSLYLTLITFVIMGNSLTAQITFVLASLFSILQFSCTICFPQAIIQAGEANVSLNRLTDFLLLDEFKHTENFPVTTEIEKNGVSNNTERIKSPSQQTRNEVGIEMCKIAANWVHGQLPPTLSEVSLTITARSLCALVGPVGSGKSSLLHLVLGELPIRAGRLSLFAGGNGSKTKIIDTRDIRISYASQDPWLFSGSVRDNILFGQPFDKERYHEVIRVCALLKDFEQLPQGDLSFVGERGAALSGGQKARVNLARAVYRDADLYLLDDPLSAVDSRVGRHLLEECINGFLKGKTRILVTHQLQYLQKADTVVVLNHGFVEHQGTFAELAKSNCHIFGSELSDENNEAAHCNDNNSDELDCKTQTTKFWDELKLTSHRVVERAIGDEEAATGEMSNKVYQGYLTAGNSLCSLIFIAAIFIAGQIAVSGTDYWVAYWTNQETQKVASMESTANVDCRETTSIRLSDLKWCNEFRLLSSNLPIYIYTFCIAGLDILTTLRSFLFVRMCMNASRQIHDSMFNNILRAKMRFFNTNPSGRIMNRFSKDIGTMDEVLPKVMLEALQIFAILLGIMAMVVIVNHWMIIPTVVMAVVLYVVRIYYLKTALNVKRLEGMSKAKSPVFSHVNSTLAGLTTIRSRGKSVQELLMREFDRHQDAHTGAWYLTIVASNAFGFILDLVSCSFIACVCFSSILMDDESTLPGSVGLAISQSLILTGLVQYGVRQSTEVISQMTSVERVLQYTNDLPKEGPFTSNNTPASTWPLKGGLILNNVSMRYVEDKPPVLKNLNLTIKPGWKIGIVGRTGAGKSSIISALFRLTEVGGEGEIQLDGIDTKSIGLHELRPRISIIPQEPILFSASLRFNLDPFNQFSDAELWDSLRQVELGDVVQTLDFKVTRGGANFSVGQRQLICLARAVLRRNRILVLDEATANVDRGTDALIQKTIRQRFTDCTILTIAHRINTIMDSDRVLVMAEGRIVEFGHPYSLLKNHQDGPFSEMVKQTGSSTSKKLIAIAESAYKLTNSGLEENLNDTLVTNNQDNSTYL